ncbi:MAG: winged helix DNA-binding domain-containing protein [candidate division KSB1 bacterium]
MKTAITDSQVAAFRLQRHHLCDKQPASLITLCRNVCGVQAQVMSAAEMAWWARNHKLTRAAIQNALWQERALIKTYALRGTLHILTAEDLPLFISALKSSHVARMHQIFMRLGLTAKEIEGMQHSAFAALRDGPLSQSELTARVKTQVGKKMREAMAKFWNVFRPLFASGLICYGPSHGQEVTFVRVESWLPHFKEVPAAEARAILLRRYLHAYGPATPQDFSRWTGLPMLEVKPAFVALAEELIELETPQAKAFLLRADEETLRARQLRAPQVRLLPSFDVFMLGHVDKSHLVVEKNYKRVYRNQGWLSHVVLFEGRVIGVWQYERRGQLWQLQLEPFEKFSKALRAQILAEAESLGKFLGIKWEAIRFGI